MRGAIAVLLVGVGGCLVGCSGGTKPPATTPQFSVAPGSYPVTQSVSITDTSTGAAIFYTTDGSAPTTASTPYTGPVQVSATETLQAIAAEAGSAASPVASAAYTIIPPVVNAAPLDFGQNIVGNTVTEMVGTVVNGAAAPAPLAISVSGDPGFSLASATTCGAQLAGNSSCTLAVSYDPSAAGTQNGSLNIAIAGDPAQPVAVTLTGSAAVMAPGVVTTTANPLVAQYTIAPPFPATVVVNFGPDTSYGRTAVTPVPMGAATINGGPTSVLVAGMQASSTYHMQATVTFASGLVVKDIDQTFQTGAIPAGILPPLTVTTTPGLTPQPGIELVDVLFASGTYSTAFATDLAGNVIWYYSFPDRQAPSQLYPIKLMPNGHFLMEISPLSQSLVAGPPPAGTLAVLREIDLAGNVVQDLTMADLNARLIANGFGNLNLQLYSHDVTLLPNGHLLVITNTTRPFTDLPGYPGVTNVVGDVVVDLDGNMTPVWYWSSFDHLDVNRHPYMFPDWTHANAVTYSADDGNFLISLRHQNWVLKVNYQNGAGDGSTVWKLGYQGDFTLANGTEPQDWFFAQHNPSFFSANTTGSFSLGIMDNGTDRMFADGTRCDVQGGVLCYTTIPVMTVDETAKTATFTSHQVLPTSLFSVFAGGVDLLANGNVEYNLAGVNGVDGGAYTFEVTPETTSSPTPQTVWEMAIAQASTYRVFRIGSLYPGIQW